MLGAHIGDEVTLTDERGQRKYIVKTISKAEATHYTSLIATLTYGQK